MEKDLCVKGWNWGTVKFGGESGERLRFGEKVGWRVSAFNLFCSLSVTASDFLSVCNSSTFSLRASSVLGTVPGLEVTVQAKCPVLRDLQSGGNMLYADSSFWRSLTAFSLQGSCFPLTLVTNLSSRYLSATCPSAPQAKTRWHWSSTRMMTQRSESKS